MGRVDELHQSLDQLTLKSLILIEELLQERQELEQSMRQGFFQMAQARSTMGVRSVSCLQLPTEDGRLAEALLKVRHETVEPDTDSVVEHVMFSVDRSTGDASKTKEADSEGLRKRAVDKDADVDGLTENLVKTKLAGKLFDSPNDPLKWFGVLVPQSLRSSQQTFHKSIRWLCRIATLQSNLESVRLQYLEQSKELEALTELKE